MKRTGTIGIAGVMLAGTLFLAPSAWSMLDRTPEEILKAYNEIRLPTVDPERRADREHQLEIARQRAELAAKQAELIGELLKSHPDHEQLVRLLPMRWNTLMTTPQGLAEVRAEVEQVARRSSNETIQRSAYFQLISITQREETSVRGQTPNHDRILAAIDAFAKHAPGDARAASALMQLAGQHPNKDTALQLYERVVADFKDAPAAKYAPGKVKQAKGVGKPFELEFTDALTGSQVDMKMLKGKVVVIDFWATWCGPCIAEMPKMKALYAEYKAQGVEFIGISLDQPEANGGLKRLLDYCEKESITWPQYYQGKFWDGDFSVSWGINSIPAIFIIDKEGRLHSTQARGKLETLIPELLAK